MQDCSGTLKKAFIRGNGPNSR